jgi:hypothetical protein
MVSNSAEKRCFAISIDVVSVELEGDIVFFQVIDQPMLLVSSAEVAFDLMEKRSAINSSKPTMIIDEL